MFELAVTLMYAGLSTTSVHSAINLSQLSSIVASELGITLYIKADVYKIRNPVYCLADNMYFEARDQSIEGQQWVTYVVFNRVNDPYYPNDVCSVVYQKSQFSWTDESYSTITEPVMWDAVYTVAAAMYSQYSSAVVYAEGATHYHADYVLPFWAVSKIPVNVIGDHVFYK